MKFYKTASYNFGNGNVIQEIESTKLTKKFIWYMEDGRETRGSLKGTSSIFHKTKEDAILHLENEYNRAIAYAERTISENKQKLAILNNYR